MHAFVCVIFLVGPLFCDVDGCGCCFIFYPLWCGRSLWESVCDILCSVHLTVLHSGVSYPSRLISMIH